MANDKAMDTDLANDNAMDTDWVRGPMNGSVAEFKFPGMCLTVWLLELTPG